MTHVHKLLMPSITILIESDAYTLITNKITKVFVDIGDLERFLLSLDKPHLITMVVNELSLKGEFRLQKGATILPLVFFRRHEAVMSQAGLLRWICVNSHGVSTLSADSGDDEPWQSFLELLHKTHHRLAKVLPYSSVAAQWLEAQGFSSQTFVIMSHMRGFQVIQARNGHVLYDECMSSTKTLTFFCQVAHDYQDARFVNTTPHKLLGFEDRQLMMSLDRQSLLMMPNSEHIAFVGSHQRIQKLLNMYNISKIVDVVIVLALVLLSLFFINKAPQASLSIPDVSAHATTKDYQSLHPVSARLKVAHMLRIYNSQKPQFTSQKNFHYDFKKKHHLD